MINKANNDTSFAKRKVIYSQMMSLDGFMEGPNQEIDWSIPGEELFKHFNEQESTIDTHLYGRRTYESMAGYWSNAEDNPESTENEVNFARIWKATPKVVFSKSLDKVEWNSRLVKDGIKAEVNKLKAEEGKDMALGGAQLASAFMELGLIDEYQIYIHPIVLGGGKPLFPVLSGSTNLRHIETRTFDQRVVLLRYQHLE